MATLPPLKTDPKYGCFLRWPQDGNDWLHPDDVALARTMIPSERVFRRDGMDGEFSCLHYGDVTLRVRPALWQEVQHEGFDIGDWVEVLSHRMRNEPRTGVIREMLWDQRGRTLHYQIFDNDVPVPDLYTREDLQHVEPVFNDAGQFWLQSRGQPPA
jgi:hypothetical protein